MEDESIPATYKRREDARRPITLEGQLVDERGRPMPSTSGWRQHPQQNRAPQPRRLQPYSIDDGHGRDMMDQDMRYADPRAMVYDDRREGVSVSVNNNGQYFRPVKDELVLSGVKTIGNFFAWPFRLVKGFIESLASGFASLIMFVLKIVILPFLLFAGYSFYKTHQDRPAAETAHEVGKAGVGLVGSMIGGVWDGVFGEDEKPKAEPSKGETSPKGAKPKND